MPRKLVHVRLGDHKEDVLALLDSDTGDAWERLEPEFLNCLAALLL